MEKTVLAIDPGRTKCGMALVRRPNGGGVTLVWRAVVARDAILPKLHEAYAAEAFQMIIVGGGTQSHGVVQEVREHLPSMGILVVDEQNTSIEARERYWEHHPRRGWRRLLPSTLQIPPEPVDDFAALVLAERVLLGA